MFPEIKEWTSSKDNLRYRKDWWKMPVIYFIMFHYLGTRLFLLLTCLVGGIFSAIALVYCIINQHYLFALISAVFVYFLGNGTYAKYKEYKQKATWTFYDLFLRSKWT